MGKELVAILMFSFFYPRVLLAASLINMSNADMSSLLALKLGFNSNILATNWSEETSFCTWIGVTCSRRHLRVTALDLSSMSLHGSIGREIGNLSFLRYLYIQNNSISGPIPHEIGHLRRLRVLNMTFNHFTDHIPLSFGNLSHLQRLELSGNQLTGELSSAVFNISSLVYFNVGDNQMSGTIPKHICSQSTKLVSLGLYSNQFEGEFPSAVIRCHSLKQLFLRDNKFTGTIPSAIGNLTSMERLNIEYNSFHGTIPSEIRQLSSLRMLDLANNKLTGEIPQSIFNFTRLNTLALDHNNLSGNLPFSIDKSLPSIAQIFISNNQFRGKIPSSISNLSKLTLLELSNNSFTGQIPTTLGNLPQLQILSLAENQFTNNLSVPEQDFMSSLAACKYLTTISLSYNLVSGVLPKSLGSANLSASLRNLLIEFCQIRGPLPNEIGNLTNLVILALGNNELTGVIPAAFGNLRSLQGLDMFANMFHGSVSCDICNMENLYFINFEDNNLYGQLPSCLGNLSMLRGIYFSSNALNFTISSTLWFDEHIERISISNNFIHGSLPGEIGNLKDLIVLDLSRNQLSGEIPSPISQLQKLITLSLSNNKLNGSILDSFADLKDLQYLDLSHNHLSGPIPTSLEKLVNLKYFNVSFNELAGQIPDGGPFINFTHEFFAGNKGLCGVPRFKVGPCKRSKSTSSSKKKLLRYILPVIALVVVAAIILIFVWRRRARKLLPSSQFDLPLVVMPERISYYDILPATNNLNEQNLIGRGSFGSVYRANFSNALVAAVKVFNLDVQGAFKSFDIECQILRNIRHRNLVKVITSCSNLDFKALVMAYMPNGNLERWLYSGDCSLNLFQRLGIMMDVASAVEYLHEGYTSPIVHCDLKPNNILLDEDMVAHVGDFGISKLLTQEQRMLQTTTLGTIGYIAPEYGSEGLVSTMVDVYSYGILLMEVFTRRRPTDEMFSGELTMRQWVSESFPNSIMRIVDHQLLVNMDDRRNRANCEKFLTSAMELALECTVDMAEERPNMKDVVARMNKIQVDLSARNS